MECISVYVTFPDEKTAQSILNSLIEDKAIACANIMPIKSMYWWQDEVVQEGELAALIKSRATNWAYLVKRITTLHPYEVPCIIRYPIEPNAAYADWIYEVTKEMA